MSSMFKPVVLNKASSQIISQIRKGILEGKIRPGDKLPPEPELLSQLNVSKHTLREALRALEYLGLLESKKGVNGGFFVTEMSKDVVREILSNFFFFKKPRIEHFSELRELIEPYAAKLAAVNSEEKDISILEELANMACDELISLEDIFSSEVEFHRVIASLSKNPLLELIVDFVDTALIHVKKAIGPNSNLIQIVTLDHRKILSAIKEKNAEKAWEEMRIHIRNVEDELAKSLDKKLDKFTALDLNFILQEELYGCT